MIVESCKEPLICENISVLKKKLAKNWFKTLQEVLCREIEEKEGNRTKFKIIDFGRCFVYFFKNLVHRFC